MTKEMIEELTDIVGENVTMRLNERLRHGIDTSPKEMLAMAEVEIANVALEYPDFNSDIFWKELERREDYYHISGNELLAPFGW